MAANSSRSSTKRSSTSAKRKPASAKKTPARKTAATRKNTRSSRATSSGSKRRTSSRRTTATQKNSGVVGTVKQVAGKAAKPAIAVGAAAAAAGIAGGIALKNRSNGTKLLGVRVPDIDPKSVAQSVGKASKRFASASKSASKDLEHAGDQAQRIGKILD